MTSAATTTLRAELTAELPTDVALDIGLSLTRADNAPDPAANDDDDPPDPAAPAVLALRRARLDRLPGG